MITAKQAKELTASFLTPELLELELKIKAAAQLGHTSISLRDSIWSKESRYQKRALTLRKTLEELGYTINFLGVGSEITELSWG